MMKIKLCAKDFCFFLVVFYLGSCYYSRNGICFGGALGHLWSCLMFYNFYSGELIFD
jgi:hypothetical protein